MELKRRRRVVGTNSAPKKLLFCCLFLCFLSILVSFAAGTARSRTETYYTQGEVRRGGVGSAAWARRRSLGGPGSYPPRCAAKCGNCTPCRPVHVPVPPGTPVTTEYYPEAWRCKCGNRLYMP